MKQQQGHRPPSARWWSSDPTAPSGQPSRGPEPEPLQPQPRAVEVGLGKALAAVRRQDTQIGRGTHRSGREGTGSGPGTPYQAPPEGAMAAHFSVGGFAVRVLLHFTTGANLEKQEDIMCCVFSCVL
ncbi:hypothetical protein GQ55_2G359900 [Panicum hallii var. hallii]|uniref:Uncharacterized protein n=1 Tax=Panicum hallii var. hallii TaxID=1504633 RepID=A0A2T7EW22_9POAL|nr:hypothetical protein GQ55_2G359900 [Panicum hallii var. hallii]